MVLKGSLPHKGAGGDVHLSTFLPDSSVGHKGVASSTITKELMVDDKI